MTIRPTILLFICILAVVPTSASLNEENLSDESSECISEQVGASVFLDGLQVVLPQGLDLISFGLDGDYANVFVLRYLPSTNPRLNIGVVIRESPEPREWPLHKDAVLVEKQDFSVDDDWTVYRVINLPETDKTIAGLYNANVHIKVMAPDAMNCLRQIVVTKKSN